MAKWDPRKRLAKSMPLYSDKYPMHLLPAGTTIFVKAGEVALTFHFDGQSPTIDLRGNSLAVDSVILIHRGEFPDGFTVTILGGGGPVLITATS